MEYWSWEIGDCETLIFAIHSGGSDHTSFPVFTIASTAGNEIIATHFLSLKSALQISILRPNSKVALL